ETQVIADLIEGHRLIRYCRIDAEAAGVWAPQAAHHRHHLEERRFGDRRFDEFPALAQAGKSRRLPPGAELQPDRALRRRIAQQILNKELVGKAEHVVKILRSVLRVPARMRS